MGDKMFKAQTITATPIKHSSIVGGGVMLTAPNGVSVGQIAFLGLDQAGLSRQFQTRLSKIIADAINAANPGGDKNG